MSVVRHCCVRDCAETSRKSLTNFYGTGWSAMQYGKNPVVCLCPKHQDFYLLQCRLARAGMVKE